MRLLIPAALLLASTTCRSTTPPGTDPAHDQLTQLVHGIALRFQFYDADGDGRLSFTEWFRTELSRRPDGTAIFTSADIDADGFLTTGELRTWTPGASPSPR